MLPTPPPTSPSAGKPEMAEDQRPAEQGVERDAADAEPQHHPRPLERRDEVAQQLEQQPGRGAPHVGAQERLALARRARRTGRTRASAARRATAAASRAAATIASSHRPARKVRRTSRTALNRWPKRGRHHRRGGGDQARAGSRLKVKVRLSASVAAASWVAPSRPISSTSVAWITCCVRLARISGQASASVARSSSRHGRGARPARLSPSHPWLAGA